MAHLANPQHVLLLACATLLAVPGCDTDAPLPEDLELDEALSDVEDLDDIEDFEDLDLSDVEDLDDADDVERPAGAGAFEDGDSAVLSSTSLSRKGNTIATADLDGDGAKELYTAFYSPTLGAAIYKGTKSAPTQQRVFGPTLNRRVTHLAGGDVNGDGIDELYIGLEDEVADLSELSKMDASGARTVVHGFSNLGLTALAVGDADGMPGQELLSAYVDSVGFASIFTSQTGNTRGSFLRGAPNATFVSIAVADFGGGEKLCVAFQTAGQTGIDVGSHPMYRSNGPIWTVTAMEAGDSDADGDEELYVALRHTDGLSAIYRSDFGISLNARDYGPSQYWDVASVQVGQLDSDAAEEIVTGFNHVSGVSSMYLSENGTLPGVRVYGPNSVWEL